jgi:Flp pilus assembly protein TadB
MTTSSKQRGLGRDPWFRTIFRPGVNLWATAMTFGWLGAVTALTVQLPSVVVPLTIAAVAPVVAWYVWMMAEWRAARQAQQESPPPE